MSNTVRNRLRALIRARDDFQAMRKRMDNRLGRKADGTAQDVGDRDYGAIDSHIMLDSANVAREQENRIEREIKAELKAAPIYTEFLSKVKGCGPISAAWIIAEYDIHIADTPSKLWQFTGLNPGMVRGRVAIKGSGDGGRDGSRDGGKVRWKLSDTMIRGDRLTQGFLAPFNQRLRTAMVGVMAESFIRSRSEYSKYYYDFKARLEAEQSVIDGSTTKWCDTTKAHRDRAAKRYMIKMFLRDLYIVWRELEGLPVRPPYQEEYLGHSH